MTKSYLINTSVAALVSAFVFSANVSPASACWGPNKEFGGLECGKGGGTDGASQSSQSSQNSQTSQTSSNGPNTRPLPRPDRPGTSSQADNSKMQDDWNKGSGYGGGNDKQKDGDWGSGQRPPRQSSDNGDWGGKGGSHRPPKTQSSDSGCRYGCGDDRPSRRPRDDYGSNDRGPVYFPKRDRGPYVDDSYDRRPRYPRDDYGSYGRHHGDYGGYYRPSRVRVILVGPGYGGQGGYGGGHRHGGGDWNMSGGYGGR